MERGEKVSVADKGKIWITINFFFRCCWPLPFYLDCAIYFREIDSPKKRTFFLVFVNLVLSDRVAQCTNFFLISFLPFFVLIFFYGFDLKKKKGCRRADTPMETNKSFQEWVGGIWNLKMYIHSREPFLQFRSSSVEKNKDVYRLYTCIYSPTCTWALRNFLILFFDFISFWSQKGKMEEAGFRFPWTRRLPCQTPVEKNTSSRWIDVWIQERKREPQMDPSRVSPSLQKRTFFFFFLGHTVVHTTHTLINSSNGGKALVYI